MLKREDGVSVWAEQVQSSGGCDIQTPSHHPHLLPLVSDQLWGGGRRRGRRREEEEELQERGGWDKRDGEVEKHWKKHAVNKVCLYDIDSNG